MEKAKEKTSQSAKKIVQAANPVMVKGSLQGFMDFVREQGVVGLAVGLAIGAQVKQVVDQIVISFINPLVKLLSPSGRSLVDQTFTLHVGNRAADFGWGAFVSTLFSFLAVAASIYYVVKGLKLDKLDKKKLDK